jgi:hypothetical protein
VQVIWYKNWLETMPWVGFVSTILLGFLFLMTIVFHDTRGLDPGLRFIFPMLTTFGFLFMAGSGIRAQPNIFSLYLSSKESAAFTLSLPVSRRRLLLIRTGFGLLEATAISLVFTILFLLIIHPQENLTIANLVRYFIKVLACGIEFYFLSTFLTTFLNDFCHKSAMFLFPFLLSIYSAQGYIPEPLDAFRMLQFPMTNALPWIQILLSLALGGIFLIASIKVVKHQEY